MEGEGGEGPASSLGSLLGLECASGADTAPGDRPLTRGAR